MDSIYLNMTVFDEFIAKQESLYDAETVQLLLKARLFSSYVHEMTHVLIRKVTRDLNASTPVLSHGHIAEAGFEAERTLYGAPVQWDEGLDLWFTYDDLRKFCDSIDNNSDLFRFENIKKSGIRSSISFCMELERKITLEF
jgi:hypothetical protein